MTAGRVDAAGRPGDDLVHDGSGPTGRSERRSLLRAGGTVFAIAFIVFALSPVITNYDSYSAFPTAVSLVNRQTLSLDAYAGTPTLRDNYTVSRVDGHLLTGYPWAVSLFFVPTVAVVDAVHVVGGPSADSLVRDNEMSIVQLETASLVTALACAVLTWLAFDRFGGSLKRRRRMAMGCGLVFAFGTSAWSIASRSMWQHGPSLLLIAVGLALLDRSIAGPGSQRTRRWQMTVCAVAFASAVAVRPSNLVVAAVVAVVVAVRHRPFLTRFVVGALVVAVPWTVVTALTYGSLFEPSERSGGRLVQPSFFDALGANLFSPARGLLVFSPVVLFAVAGVVVTRRRRHFDSLEWISLCSVPLLWLVVSGAGFGSEWWAGSTYGPRYMSETLPFLFVLSLPAVDWLCTPSARKATARRRWVVPVAVSAAALLIVASVAVNAEGGVLRSTTCWNGPHGSSAGIDQDPARVWSWSDPQFLTGFRSLSNLPVHAAVMATCGEPAVPKN